MGMGTAAARRRALVITLGVCLLILFLALATLNAFNLKFLNPASPTQTLVFIALSTVAFLLFVGVLVLLVRNVLKLYADQRSRVLGTRLRTRMLWGAVLVSFVPLVFMFAFSYLLMNRAQERWFSQPVSEMRQDSTLLVKALDDYINANARSEADSIASDLSASPAPPAAAAVKRELARHEVTLQGGFAIVYRDSKPIGALHVPRAPASASRLKSAQPADLAPDETPATPIEIVPLPGPTQSAILQAAQRNDGSIYSLASADYILSTAATQHGGLVVVGLPIPPHIASISEGVRSADHNYLTLFNQRKTVRTLYMILLLLITALALFACCWLALYISKQVTRPVESLADAMESIAAGDYGTRVPDSATEELGELTASFNTMAADLESARALADQSAEQLSELNTTLQARRTELETIIETIPNGVVTLSADRHVVVANRAFAEMLDPGGRQHFAGSPLDTFFPPETIDALDHILRRSHRMGTASAELQMSSPAGPSAPFRNGRRARRRCRHRA